jgi:acyl carrier protein
MEKLEVKETIIELIADQFGYCVEDLHLEDSLKLDLCADDLDLTEILMELEDDFDLRIEESDFELLKTVRDVVEYIYNKVK